MFEFFDREHRDDGRWWSCGLRSRADGTSMVVLSVWYMDVARELKVEVDTELEADTARHIADMLKSNATALDYVNEELRKK
jgi:hypothetical protein